MIPATCSLNIKIVYRVVLFPQNAHEYSRNAEKYCAFVQGFPKEYTPLMLKQKKKKNGMQTYLKITEQIHITVEIYVHKPLENLEIYKYLLY